MSLLEQDITKKGRVKTTIELDKNDSKKYKVKAICYSKLYAKELDNDYLLGFYYLVS